jgi:hypothetical protein
MADSAQTERDRLTMEALALHKKQEEEARRSKPPGMFGQRTAGNNDPRPQNYNNGPSAASNSKRPTPPAINYNYQCGYNPNSHHAGNVGMDGQQNGAGLAPEGHSASADLGQHGGSANEVPQQQQAPPPSQQQQQQAPASQPVLSGVQVIKVTLGEGQFAGETIQVNGPDGRVHSVTVPSGLGVGDNLEIRVNPPVQPPQQVQEGAVDAAPQEVETAPQEIEAAPQEVEAAPQEVELAPQEVEASPQETPVEAATEEVGAAPQENPVEASRQEEVAQALEETHISAKVAVSLPVPPKKPPKMSAAAIVAQPVAQPVAQAPEEVDGANARWVAPDKIEAPEGANIVRTPDGTTVEIRPDGTVIQTAPDGTKVEKFPDGTKTITSATGVKLEFLKDGTEKQTFEDGTVLITKPDGSQMQFNRDGTILEQTQGDVLQKNPNGVMYELQKDGTKATHRPDGTTVVQRTDGTKVKKRFGVEYDPNFVPVQNDDLGHGTDEGQMDLSGKNAVELRKICTTLGIPVRTWEPEKLKTAINDHFASLKE